MPRTHTTTHGTARWRCAARRVGGSVALHLMVLAPFLFRPATVVRVDAVASHRVAFGDPSPQHVPDVAVPEVVGEPVLEAMILARVEVDERPEESVADHEPVAAAPPVRVRPDLSPVRVRRATPEPDEPVAVTEPEIAASSPQRPEPAPAPSPRAPPEPLEHGNEPPAYPPRALRLRLQGEVLLSVAVDAAGTVRHCTVAQSSGHDELDRAAIEAVRAWRFRDGPGDVHVPIRFALRR